MSVCSRNFQLEDSLEPLPGMTWAVDVGCGQGIWTQSVDVGCKLRVQTWDVDLGYETGMWKWVWTWDLYLGYGHRV